MGKHKAEFKELDDLIRSGEHRSAKSLFLAIFNKSWPREFHPELAAFARRLSIPEAGIRLLHSRVYPGARQPTEATSAEISEYAGCAIRLGLISEGLRLLDRVRSEDYPRTDFFRGLAHIARWDYRAANQWMSKFASRSQVDPYEKLVAQVNVVAGHLFLEEVDSASPILNRLLEETTRENLTYLKSTTLEFLAQKSLLAQEWGEAEKYISEAERMMGASDTIDALLIRKQRAIVHLLRHPHIRGSDQGLRQVREDAIRMKRWETLRDCDYYLATGKQDETLARHLFFGTPYEKYREKITSQFDSFDFQSPYVWKIGRGRRQFMNRNTGEITGAGVHLKSGQVLHRLIQAIASDFYRPQQVMDLFEKVYPTERYTDSTSDKVHQIQSRLRKYFSKTNFSAKIERTREGFRIGALRGTQINIECPFYDSMWDSRAESVRRWAQRMKNRPYNIHELVQLTHRSERSLQRDISHAIKVGLLRRESHGPATVYFPKCNETMRPSQS